MEEIKKYVESKGGSLVSWFPASFPVYVVHLEYNGFDTDPLFPVYKALLRYILLEPSLESGGMTFFSNLIGFDRDFIDRCRKNLDADGMIRFQDGKYIVTEDAQRKYLIGGNRPVVRVNGSILLDGKDLSFLPDLVYDNYRNLRTRSEGNRSVHLPIDLELDQAPAIEIKRKLDKANSSKLEKLHLESSGSEFQVLEFDKKYLQGAWDVFYRDSNGKLRKEILYKGHKIDCTALEVPNAFTIDLVKDGRGYRFKANLGYNVSSEEQIKDVAVIATREGWSAVLTERYRLSKQCSEILEEAGAEGPEAQPLQNDTDLLLTETMFKHSKNPIILVDDSIRGYVDFPLDGNGFVRIQVRNTIQFYVNFIMDLEKWEKEGCLNGEDMAMSLSRKYPDWRSLMVSFKKFDLLEKLDMACFIKYAEE